MNRSLRMALIIAASLGAVFLIVNWANHVPWLEQFHNNRPGVIAFLALAGWLLREYRLGKKGHFLPGVAIAFVTWQWFRLILLDHASSDAILRQSSAAWLSLVVPLTAHLTLESWTGYLKKRFEKVRPGLDSLAAAALLAGSFYLAAGPLMAPPFMTVFAVAALAALLRQTWLKHDGALLTMLGASITVFMFSPAHLHFELGRAMNLTAADFPAQVLALGLGLFWEEMDKKKGAWLAVLLFGLFVPLLMGVRDLGVWTRFLSTGALLWWGHWLYRQAAIEGKESKLPSWLRGSAPRLRMAAVPFLTAVIATYASRKADLFGLRMSMDLLWEYFVPAAALAAGWYRARSLRQAPDFLSMAGLAMLAQPLGSALAVAGIPAFAAATLLFLLGAFFYEAALDSVKKKVQPLSQPWPALLILAALAGLLIALQGYGASRQLRLLLVLVFTGALLREYGFKKPAMVLRGLAALGLGVWTAHQISDLSGHRVGSTVLPFAAAYLYITWEAFPVKRWVQVFYGLLATLPFGLLLFENMNTASMRKSLFHWFYMAVAWALIRALWPLLKKAAASKQVKALREKPLWRWLSGDGLPKGKAAEAEEKAKPIDFEKAAAWAKAHRRGLMTGALVLVTFGLIWTGMTMWRQRSTVVEQFTPQGLVASPSVVIQAKFSKPVSATTQDLSGSITVDPPLKGQVRLADDKTLVFEPEEALRPSTQYSATLDTSKLSTMAFHLQSSAGTEFHTERFKINNLRLYYNWDLLHREEKELVGEVDFNYPVSLEEFKRFLTIKRHNGEKGFTVEQGLFPTRFFFKVGGLKRQEVEQQYSVHISKDLLCQDCGIGLEEDYSKTITLPALPKFEMNQVDLHHQPGTTLVSVNFSLPITNKEARKHISVAEWIPSKKYKDPDGGHYRSVDYKVRTEYAYAVVNADFLPNRNYRVIIDEQMRSKSGQLIVAPTRYDKKLKKHIRMDIVRDLKIRDAQPYVDFVDGGNYLPAEGSRRLAVKTMNLDNFRVSVHRVFRNNLVHYLRDNYGFSDDSRYGQHVLSRTKTVSGGDVNEEVITQLDSDEWLQGPFKGLYNVTLHSNRTYQSRRKWMIATDIGLVAKSDGDDLWVQALSIETLRPKSGLQLEMFSRENQVLKTYRTDSRGRVRIKNYTDKIAEMHPFVLVANDGDDFAFLRLSHQAIPTSRFDTGGDPVNKEGFEGFLTSDRGLYRPGDEAHLTALLRRHDLKLAKIPVQIVIYNPQGREAWRGKLQPDSEGMMTATYPLRLDALTGEYRAEMSVANARGGRTNVATTNFKIEEFIPNKIKANIELKSKEAEAGGKIEYTARALHLFGAPASGLKVKTLVELVPGRFRPKKYQDYRFIDTSRSFSSETIRVPQGTTGPKGERVVELDIPTSVLPASMILGKVYAEVYDDGGRPVGANATVRIHRYPYYLGIKSADGLLVEPGKQVTVNLVALKPSGKKTKVKDQLVSVKRKTWYSIFRSQGWRGQFQSSFYEEIVTAKKININGSANFTFKTDKEGEYTVVVGNETGMRTSLVIKAQGRSKDSRSANEVVAANLQDPGRLSLKLDKPRYQPGETARVEVNAPFPGRLMLSIERETLFDEKNLEIPAGTSFVNLPVPSGLNPNAYVVGLLVRKPDEKLRQLPMTSFGVIPLPMDNRSKEIILDWVPPEEVTSATGIDIDMSLGNRAGAKVVIAAVDEGILQIINFQTPDPFSHFYRKRRLDTRTMTFFDQVLPDLARRYAVGGDEDEDMMRRHLNPVAAKRVKSFAKFSGVLTADSQGRIRHRIPTDDFQGEVRVMALAVKGDHFGGKAFHVRVSDPVVLQSHLPRFMAPEDLVKVPVRVFNQTDKKQTLKVSLFTKGPVDVTGKVTRTLTLGPKSQESLEYDVRAEGDAGVAHFKVQAVTADGQTFKKETELAVRPSQPLSTVMKYGRLAPGKSTGLGVPGDFIKFGRRARVHVSANPLYEFIGAFSYLVRYPYGCAEQKTSKAFPMLALKETGLLGSAFSLVSGDKGQDRKADKYVQQAVRDLEKLQMSDGRFRLWPGDSYTNDYLSNYVSHFLLEAQRAGYTVGSDTLRRIRKRIGAIHIPKKKKGRLDRSQQNQPAPHYADDPYVLYLRTLAGFPDRESMNAIRYDKRRLKEFNVFDRSVLAAAFAEIGDAKGAREVLPPKDWISGKKLYRESGGNWASSNRDLALYLLGLSVSEAPMTELDATIEEVRKRMKAGHFGTTQENAWTFIALNRASKRFAAEKPLRAEMKVGEQGAVETLTKERTLKGSKSDLWGKTVHVTNKGEGNLAYILLAEGTRLKAEKKEESKGMKIRRIYRDEKGDEIRLGNVVQGQLVVVTLEVECFRDVENLVVVDLLPAGFEVDNPRLQSQGRLGFTPPFNFQSAYQDFRDDRVLLFTTKSQRYMQFSYSVRAVAPGTYDVPALLVEAMYDPDIFGRYDYGEKLVVSPNKF